MHRIRLAVLLFLCVSAAGCQPVPGVLLDAEAIVMEHPDSAARLLKGVPAPEKRLSRRNYAHYALVLTQARWLAGENMIDDTLSDVALDYYRTHTDDFAAAHKAYYYAAKIANQRRQPEVAMTLLLKSRDMLPPKGEWRRRYVVETWLGVFCGQQHLFEEKIRHAQQAYAYADSMERYDWMCISLGDMAHAYMGLDNYDSMEYYALKALRLAEEKGITENTSPKWAMLIESALKRKEYRKAEEYWEKGFGHAPAWTRYSWLSTKADICNRTGRYDTALELTDSSRRMCADTTHLTSRALWALNTSNAWEGKGDAARSLEALKQLRPPSFAPLPFVSAAPAPVPRPPASRPALRLCPASVPRPPASRPCPAFRPGPFPGRLLRSLPCPPPLSLPGFGSPPPRPAGPAAPVPSSHGPSGPPSSARRCSRTIPRPCTRRETPLPAVWRSAVSGR